MRKRRNSVQLPPTVILVSLIPVLLDLHLQEPGVLQITDLLLFFLFTALLIPFGYPGLRLALLMLLYLFFFQYRLQLAFSQYLPVPESSVRVIRGILREDPSWLGEYTLRLELDCRGVDSDRGVSATADCPLTVYMNRGNLSLNPFSLGQGSRISVKGSFSGSTGTGGKPVFNGKSLTVSPGHTLWDMRTAFLKQLRSKCALLGEGTEVLLPALILGMDHPGKGAYALLFRQSGTAHIMALSGFHAGLVGVLLFLTGRLLLGYRGGYLVSMAGLILFLWLAGFRPSLVRAVGMYLLFAAGKLTHRNYRGLPVLFFTYFLSGILDPLSLGSLSSRLSYLALAGILISGVRLNTLLAAVIPLWLRLPLCASLGAQLWTSYLVLFVFGKTYPIGLAASLLLTPLVTLYLYGGILWLCLPPLFLFRSLFSLFTAGLEGLLKALGIFFGCFHPIEALIEWPGPFLLFLIPVLLLEFYLPGRLHGTGKTGFKLRLHFRNQGFAGDDGPGPAEALGAELSD